MSKQITQFNKVNLKALRADIDNALEAVFTKHGITGSLGNINFDATEFRSKLTVNTKRSNAEHTNDARDEFELYAFQFGLTGKEFGKSFTQGRDTFVITGIKPRSHKYPILATNKAGKTFKFPATSAKTAA